MHSEKNEQKYELNAIGLLAFNLRLIQKQIDFEINDKSHRFLRRRIEAAYIKVKSFSCRGKNICQSASWVTLHIVLVFSLNNDI